MGYNWTYLLFGLLLLCNLMEECGWHSAGVMPSDFYTYQFSGNNRITIIDTIIRQKSLDFYNGSIHLHYSHYVNNCAGYREGAIGHIVENERLVLATEKTDNATVTPQLNDWEEDEYRRMRNSSLYRKWKRRQQKRPKDRKQVSDMDHKRVKEEKPEKDQARSNTTALPISDISSNLGVVISGLYIVGTFLVSINCFVLLTMIHFIRRKRKSKCVSCNVVVHVGNQRRKRRHARAELDLLQENSETDSESKSEVLYGQARRRLREKMLKGIQRFGKLGKNRKPGGTVQVTEYEEIAPQYLYTSVSQDGAGVTTRGDIEEIVENEYEEIPADGWNMEEAAGDNFEYLETGAVAMKEYEEAPVTYHGSSICDDEKMLSDEPVK